MKPQVTCYINIHCTYSEQLVLDVVDLTKSYHITLLKKALRQPDTYVVAPACYL